MSKKIPFLLILIVIGCSYYKPLNPELIKINLDFDKRDTLFDGGVFKFLHNIKIDTSVIIQGQKIKGNIGYIYFQPNPSDTLRSRLLSFKFLKNDTCYMCFDCNGNQDLSDEKIYKYNYPYKIKIDSIQILDGSHRFNQTLYLTPKKSSLKFETKGSDKLFEFGVVITPIYKNGYFIDGNKKYQIILTNMFNGSYTDKTTSTYILSSQNIEPNFKLWERPFYHLGDTIFLAKNTYKLSSIDSNGTSCIINRISDNTKSTGIEIGEQIPEMEFHSIQTNQKINIFSGKEKYILLDFWGSWCAPCRELTPSMLNLYAKYGSSKVNIIGIANDDKESALNYIKGQKIPWINILDSFELSPISRKYKVSSFPSYILIDSSGKIVYRGIGKEGLMKIQLIIESI